MTEFTVATKDAKQVVDITDRLAEVAEADGLLHAFVKHTTAALGVADLDPGGTDLDYLDALTAMVPKLDFRHPHDPAHMPDHILATLVGPSVTVPVKDGKLQLGQWQRIVLFEFDGPRERSVIVTGSGADEA